MHEIAHVERRDNLIVLLQAIAKAAFWPIPFVHLLNRELERAREEICDNHVLASRDAVSYGETLLRVAHLACETEMPVGTVGILHWRGKLEDRIFGLIHKGRSKMTRLNPLIALGVLTLFLSASALLCGTTIVTAQPLPAASDTPAVAQEQPAPPQKPEKAQEKDAFTAWGQEVGGLQAGLGYRPGEKRVYSHGETVTLVVRVRNVGNEDVKFRYLKEFFMETPPLVTGGEGETIRQGGLVLFGRLVHVPVDVNLAPGKELELHDLKLKLAPASGSGDVTEVSPDALHGKGKFQIQYEQLAHARIDPNLTKLATGKLELGVKKPEKQPQKEEKEAFTAWGKEINGLQAGLGFRSGEKRAYHHGETVKLVVRVRNVGKEPVKFEYLKEFFMETPPTATDSQGKPVFSRLDGVLGLIHLPVEVTLAAGKEIELYELKPELKPASDNAPNGTSVLHGTGTFQLQYDPVFGNSSLGGIKVDPTLSKLATGKLELEVKEPEKQPQKKEEKEPFTAWGKKVGGLQAGLGFRPGEKRAYRHGETVTLVLRLRNPADESDGKPQAVEFKHIRAFFVENPPTITDADGKAVQLPNYRTRDQALHMPRSSTVLPGKEVELYEWTFALQPKGENSSRSFIHGTGKHTLQCERIVGPTWLNPDHPNPALGELATGKLELDITSDLSDAPEKKGARGAKLQPGTEKKLHWGEPANGLRLALAWPPTLGEPAAGDVPDFFLAVQNVSEKPVRLCTTADAPNTRRLTISTDGIPQIRTVIEEPSGTDVTLEPSEVLFLRLFSEKLPDQPSRGPLIAAGVKQIPTRTLLADMEIKNAPKGAWTGMIVTPSTRAGIGAEAPKKP